MRRTIFPFALAAGTLLLIPFITLADTGGKAEARLTLNVVIDISVADNWDPLTINLADLAGWGAGAVIDWDTGDDDIEVTVKALTNFKVWASYYASVPSTDFGNANEL
ncbi:MAG: hypothetical protein GXO72_06355, partial [Caldiserica bacterium]|nr:hypothetical protein [Caldisericota bacterium]